MKKTRAAGFSGTVVTTWEEDASTMSDKSGAGAPLTDMSRKSKRIVPPAPGIAAQDNGRRCFTGLMIHESFEFC